MFVLMCNNDGCGNTFPLAVYANHDEAETEARRLEKEHARTDPPHSAWCARRWLIVEQWRAEGRPMTTIANLPTDAGETEIFSIIGPCPELIGHPSCDVVEVPFVQPES